MKELITRSQADTLIGVVAVLGVIAAVVAAILGRRNGRNPIQQAALFGGPLLICALLWPIYNAIEDHFGLDSVAALAVNAALFAVIGIGAGVGFTAFFGKEGRDSRTIAANNAKTNVK